MGAGLSGGHHQPCVPGEEPCQEPVTVTLSTRLGTSGMQTSPWDLGKTNRLGSAPLDLPGPQTPRGLLPARPSQTSQPEDKPCVLTRSDQPTEVTESPSTERSQSRVTWRKEGVIDVR